MAAIEYVVALRTLRYVAPTFPSSNEFTPGEVDLEGFVIQTTTAEIVTQFTVSAVTSHNVDYRYTGHRSQAMAESRVSADLGFNATRAVREVLVPISLGVPPPEPETAPAP